MLVNQRGKVVATVEVLKDEPLDVSYGRLFDEYRKRSHLTVMDLQVRLPDKTKKKE